MASGDTLCIFYPMSNEPPSSGYATPDARNGRPCLDFDGISQETAQFTSVLPRNYSGGGVGIYVHHAATSGTTGTVGWVVDFERVGDRQLDIDSDSFGPSQIIGAETVSSTAGEVDIVYTTMVDGSGIDNTLAGEMFRFRIKRDVSNDTCPSDAELYAIEIREL